MEGVSERFNGQTLLIGNSALAGALQRIRGKSFSAPVQSMKFSHSYGDSYGDEYTDAYPDYQDTTYDE